MKNQPISVMIVDDSALMRNLIGRIVEGDPSLKVAGKAMNGVFALEKLPRLDPDVIILDLEMPEMNGIEFLKERQRLGLRIPVIILSSLASKGAEITMEALSLGASDFIMKPSGPVSPDIQNVASSMLEMIHAYGGQYRRNRPKKTPAKPAKPAERTRVEVPVVEIPRSAPPSEELKPVPLRVPEKIDLVAIGISTGGPNALREVFAQLDESFSAPVVVVQHMPPGFTAEFAKSLARICPLEVKEAEDGDLLRPGRILIAPGDRHMVVERRPLSGLVRLQDGPPVNGHRPSVDILFESAATHYRNGVLGVIMTGMGKDGARMIGEIYREGGITLGQDEASSIVYGMPRAAFEYGFIRRQVPLKKMAATLSRIVQEPGL